MKRPDKEPISDRGEIDPLLDLTRLSISRLIVELAQTEYALRAAPAAEMSDEEVVVLLARERATIAALRDRQVQVNPLQAGDSSRELPAAGQWAWR